jgi:uncharacterized membrane protein
MSGFAMLCLVYYLGADLYLIDPAIADLTQLQAIGISLGSLAFGWIAYDLICKSKFGDNNTRLMLGLYVILVGMAWGYTQVFTGRAALLHLGAFTATIMTANVFFIIMPNQRTVVADLKAGRKPDAKYGKIAKQRSTHNNYLTLPVVFLMLSNHYPLAFASPHNWLIASLVFLMGVTIRHWFNTKHARKGNPHWTWLATAVLFIIIVWLSTVQQVSIDRDNLMSRAAEPFAEAPQFAEVQSIIETRCTLCHATEPAWPGMSHAPKAVNFEDSNQTALLAKRIYIQAGLTHAMPPANVSSMTLQERALVRDWYRSAAGG